MHILFFTDFYPPEVNAPASRTYEHCLEWVRLGHNVTVVTSVPNFPKGKVFPNYKNRLWQRQIIDGIEVIRVWTFISPNVGFLKRFIDQFSYFFPALIAGLFVRKVDIIVGTSPNFFSACAAYNVAILKRVPWVFELRDIWPESIRALGAMKGEWVLDLFEKLELLLYQKSTVIISVTRAFKKNLIKRGIEAKKIHVVTNGVDLSRFSPRPKDSEFVDQLGLDGKFIIGYIGTHGASHALETLVYAAKFAQSKEKTAKLHFLFIGHGSEKSRLMGMASEFGLNNVSFVDTVSKNKVVKYWSILDASVVHLKDIPLFETVIPSKSFESMAMGVPILLGAAGEIADIVRSEGVGIVFSPEDYKALINAAMTLCADKEYRTQLSAAGQIAAKKFDRKTLAQSMLHVLEDITSKHLD